MENSCEETERLVRVLESSMAELEARIEEIQRRNFYDILPEALVTLARMSQLLAMAYVNVVAEQSKLWVNPLQSVSQETKSTCPTPAPMWALAGRPSSK